MLLMMTTIQVLTTIHSQHATPEGTISRRNGMERANRLASMNSCRRILYNRHWRFCCIYRNDFILTESRICIIVSRHAYWFMKIIIRNRQYDKNKTVHICETVKFLLELFFHFLQLSKQFLFHNFFLCDKTSHYLLMQITSYHLTKNIFFQINKEIFLNSAERAPFTRNVKLHLAL